MVLKGFGSARELQNNTRTDTSIADTKSNVLLLENRKKQQSGPSALKVYRLCKLFGQCAWCTCSKYMAPCICVMSTGIKQTALKIATLTSVCQQHLSACSRKSLLNVLAVCSCVTGGGAISEQYQIVLMTRDPPTGARDRTPTT